MINLENPVSCLIPNMTNQHWPDQGSPVDYIDDLIALDQWPSVTSEYVIARGEQGSPELTVTLRFNADVYLTAGDPDAGSQTALTDLGRFQLIYHQLTQPDVKVTLSSTMQAPSAESPSPVDVMVQFVRDVINFLTPISEGQPAPPAPAAAGISQRIADGADGSTQNLFALVVRVEITRNPDPVNDESKDIPPVNAVSSTRSAFVIAGICVAVGDGVSAIEGAGCSAESNGPNLRSDLDCTARAC